MVHIVSPEKKEGLFQDPTAKKIAFAVVGLFVFFLLINSIRISQAKGQLKKLAGVMESTAQLEKMIEQNNAALQNQEVALQALQKRVQATRDDFAGMGVDITKLKKQNQVLLLNNRDFIQMFESIQDDFDELRRKGVLIAYKADAGTS